MLQTKKLRQKTRRYHRVSVVVYTCVLRYSGGRRFKASLGKKLSRPPSQQITWMWWNVAANLSYMGDIGRENDV
jgi:hypothetical protein